MCGASGGDDLCPAAKPGVRRQRANHWRTRVNHYEAATEVVGDQNIEFGHRQIAARAGGPVSTVFDQFGKKGNHKLLTDYQSQHTACHDELATLYDRGTNATEFLVDEAKVWSYWDHRSGWLSELRAAPELSRRAAAETLVRVLTGWAVSAAALAGCLGCSPPVAAVEDLLVIWAENAPVAAAHTVLREVIELALGPLGKTASGVLESVQPRLYAYLPVSSPQPAGAVAGMAEAVITGIAAIQGLPQAGRGTAVDEAIALLTDAIAELRGLAGAA